MVTVPEQSKETEYRQEALDAIEFVGFGMDKITDACAEMGSRKRKGSN
jgi:hypothetical protein